MSTVTLILYYHFPQAPYYLTPGYTLSKLYSNALLALVNSRVRMTTWRQTDDEQMKMFSGSTSHDYAQNNHQLDILPAAGAQRDARAGRGQAWVLGNGH